MLSPTDIPAKRATEITSEESREPSESQDPTLSLAKRANLESATVSFQDVPTSAAVEAKHADTPEVEETTTDPEDEEPDIGEDSADELFDNPMPIEPLAIGEGEASGPIPLPYLLESLLFVSEEPVEPAKLAQALQHPLESVEAALEELRRSYKEQNRGLRIQRRAGRIQLVTNPAAADAVEDFLNLDLSSRLSKPALEALAIVAYRQPVTRAQIEAVRGVDCSGVLRKLQQLGLIEEVGRLDVVGRPILYGVTDLFLQHFGLTSLEELPDLPESEADSLSVAVALAEE